jgi:hypothetical protein
MYAEARCSTTSIRHAAKIAIAWWEQAQLGIASPAVRTTAHGAELCRCYFVALRVPPPLLLLLLPLLVLVLVLLLLLLLLLLRLHAAKADSFHCVTDCVDLLELLCVKGGLSDAAGRLVRGVNRAGRMILRCSSVVAWNCLCWLD